jgi:hypothetical protein
MASLKKYLMLCIALLPYGSANAQVSKWTDETGVTHYGDVVPEKYKRTAKPVAIRDDAPSQTQVKEAEARLGKLKATALASPSAQSAPSPASVSAPKSSEARGSLSCDELWKQYEASYACFDPYRMGNGVLRPEAFEKCQEIKPPDKCKDTRKFKR